MKLKQLKKIQQALTKFIKQVEKEDQDHVLDMDDCEKCIFALVTGESYTASGLEERLKLLKKGETYKPSKTYKAVSELFYASKLWGANREITVAEWLVGAKYVQAKLELLAQKKVINKRNYCKDV